MMWTTLAVSILEEAAKPIEAAGRAVQPLRIQFVELYHEFFNRLPELTVGLFLLFFTWALNRLWHVFWPWILSAAKVRRSRVIVSLKLVSLLIWFLGVLIATVVAFPSVTPGRALTTLGLSSIAIGFAFKDIIENFLAGTLILLREPFILGDFITCGEYRGFVEEITVRDTHIRQSDGQRVVLPNAKLFTDPVTVVTDRDFRRVNVTVAVSYGADLDRVRSLIRRAVLEQSTVHKNHDIWVFAKEFASTGVLIDVFWWTGSRQRDMRRSRDEVMRAIKKTLDAHEVALAFPVKPLYLRFPEATETPMEYSGMEETPDT